MAKPEEKTRALALRRQGKSVKEIALLLHVSKGSVSAWVRDIPLTAEQSARLHARQIEAGAAGRIAGAIANRRRKEVRIAIANQEAQAKIPRISKESLFFLGLALYWGEGTKASNGIVSVTNSDPEIIKLMIRWFRECWEVEDTRFRARIYISDIHRYRKDALLDYWEETLGIPRSQFSETIFLHKGRKVYENQDTYYGVMALRVAKGAFLRLRILSLIEQTKKVAT